jgi:hypothetical protein
MFSIVKHYRWTLNLWNLQKSCDDDRCDRKPQERKWRVAWKGLVKTRARRTNTAKCAPSMPMHHCEVPVHVWTVSIKWNFQNNPYQPSETRSWNKTGDAITTRCLILWNGTIDEEGGIRFWYGTNMLVNCTSPLGLLFLKEENWRKRYENDIFLQIILAR